MKPASSTTTAVVLVDIQESFSLMVRQGSERSTPSFESNVSNLLQAARAYNDAQVESKHIQIIHIHHHSKDSNSPLHLSKKLAIAPASYATPLSSEPVLTKDVNSSFIGTNLEARIKDLGVRQVIFAGLTTDHCVSTTVRMAANLRVLGDNSGFDGEGIIILRDATAAFAKSTFDAETVHAVNLASLDGEFGTVHSTDEVIETVIGALK